MSRSGISTMKVHFTTARLLKSSLLLRLSAH